MIKRMGQLLGIAFALTSFQVASAEVPSYRPLSSSSNQMIAGALGGSGGPATMDALGGSGSPTTADALGGSGGPATMDALGGSGSPTTADALGGSGGPATMDALGGSGEPATTDVLGGSGGSTRQLETAQLFAVGPISVDANYEWLSVLGQVLRLSSEAATVAAENIAPETITSNLFAVTGRLEVDGSVTVTHLENLHESFVPGASTVMVRAMVQDIDPGHARLQIGTTWVDYTALLWATDFSEVRPGNIVTISGIQIGADGLILAESGLLEY